MTSPIFTNNEVNLILSLRSRSVDCKVIFAQDDQAHILNCPGLRQIMKSNEAANSNIMYEDIFAKGVRKQKEVTLLIEKLLNIKKTLLNKTEDDEEH